MRLTGADGAGVAAVTEFLLDLRACGGSAGSARSGTCSAPWTWARKNVRARQEAQAAREFLQFFCRYLRSLYPAEVRIAIVRGAVVY